MRNVFVLLAFSFIVLATPRTSFAGEVRNDGWQPEAPVSFEDEFAAREIAAARFEPDEPCPCGVTAIVFLYGGASATRDLTIRVWDDSEDSLTPGTELLEASIEVVANDDLLQLLDLGDDDIVVQGAFRIGIEAFDEGRPSIGVDEDGTITEDRNFLYSGGQWSESVDAGFSGDWIIRAQVESLAEPLCAQPLTGGEGPEASDCQFLLRVAVGSESCDPVCICDPNGNGETTTNDALLCLRSSVGLDVPLECPCD